MQKISPFTSSGDGVPTPFKSNLLWPKSQKKKTKLVRHRLSMPGVITLETYDKYEEEVKKQIAETLTDERKRKIEEMNNGCQQNKVTKKKPLVHDKDNDWVVLCVEVDTTQKLLEVW